MSGFTDPREASGTPQETQGAVQQFADIFQGLGEGGLPGLFTSLAGMFNPAGAAANAGGGAGGIMGGLTDALGGMTGGASGAGTGGTRTGQAAGELTGAFAPGMGTAFADLFKTASAPAGDTAAAGITRLQEAQAPGRTRAVQEGVRAVSEGAGGLGQRFGRNAQEQSGRTVGEITQGFDLNEANAFAQLFGSSQGLQGQALGAGAGLQGALASALPGLMNAQNQLPAEQQAAMDIFAQMMSFLRPGESVIGPSTADRLLGIL